MNALRLDPLTASAVVLLMALVSPRAANAVAGLSYRGPHECPSEADFVAAVAARGGRFERLRAAEDSRSVMISIDRSGRSFRGALQVRGAEGASDAREVRAEDCAQVVNGLAVVTAIAVNGARSTQVALGTEPREDASPAAPRVPAPPSTSPEDDHLRAMNLNGVDSIQVGAGTVGVNRAMTLTLTGGLAVGVVPSVTLPRYDVAISRANFVTPPDGHHYLVGNVVRAHVSWYGDGTYKTADTSTRMNGASFGLDLCAAPVYYRRGLVVLACVEYAGGFMTFETRDSVTGMTKSNVTGLGTVGLNAELQYNLGAHFLLDFKAAGDINVSPLSAERADGSRIFKAQPFSGSFLAGLGIQY